jgi:predicted metal-dependent peptidase
MHAALAHYARRSHRVTRRWDIASAHAVNLLRHDAGMKAPPGALCDPAFRGLAAEEIYPLVPETSAARTLDTHLVGSARGQSSFPRPDRGEGQGEGSSTEASLADTWDDAGNEARHGEPCTSAPRALTQSELETLAADWHARLVTAAQQARQAGRLPSSWSRLVDRLIQPRLAWRVLLARYLMSAARDDYSYARPSRREGPALLPRVASGEADLAVAIDTSGSISEAELAEFVAEVDALKAQVRARVTLLACDERLDARAPWRFEPWEPVLLPQHLDGGAGTSFLPVFEWLAEHNRPDVLVYFTDAEGEFPAAAPAYPVIWLVKGNGRVPWGERVQLN